LHPSLIRVARQQVFRDISHQNVDGLHQSCNVFSMTNHNAQAAHRADPLTVYYAACVYQAGALANRRKQRLAPPAKVYASKCLTAILYSWIFEHI
jgi:hypothetical protein